MCGRIHLVFMKYAWECGTLAECLFIFLMLHKTVIIEHNYVVRIECLYVPIVSWTEMNNA